MSTEIKDMISSLVAVIQGASPEILQPPKETPAPMTQVLQTPLKQRVKIEYFGTHHRHLVAQPDDCVIIYAWTNCQKTAIAYNTRNDTAGQIPAAHLIKESQSVIRDEICVSNFDNDRKEIGDLTWKAGDYIRICKWNGFHGIQGIGFNLANMEIGPFHAGNHGLMTIRPSDEPKSL